MMCEVGFLVVRLIYELLLSEDVFDEVCEEMWLLGFYIVFNLEGSL